jgi:hypothetical protein
MDWNLEKLRLLAKDQLNDISSGKREKLVRAMSDVPVAKMIDAVNFIDKNLLPAVKKKSGDKSADYEFFTNVIDYLLWCIVIVDRYETLEGRWISQKLEIHLLREQCEYLQRELSRYVAMEDLMMSGTMDVYAERVKNAATDRLKKTKGYEQ